MRFRLAAALGVAALIAVSCGGVTDPSNNTVDTFTATLPVGGFNIHPFSASNSGEISVIIKALSPVSSAVLGVIYGLPQSDGSCAAINGSAGSLSSVVFSNAVQKGSYCLGVYDYFSSLTVPENYTITVSHP
ncbi:MAG TPA: hypothetical protein VGJ29_08930 [Vicinamibacterales bacterium]